MIKLICRVLALAAIVTTTNADAQTKIEQAAITAIRDTLKDPGSAMFRGVSTYTASDKSRHVCGEVNAKNSYGGYVGYGPFAAIHKGGRITLATTDERSSIDLCSPQKIEAEIQNEISRKKEEAGALCPDSTTESTPGQCGELLSKCKSRLRFLDYSEKTEFMRHCRINGFESAADRWNTPDPNKVK